MIVNDKRNPRNDLKAKMPHIIDYTVDRTYVLIYNVLEFNIKVYSHNTIDWKDDMSTVLMSIKPKYVSNILSGNKKYEFRKKACKRAIEKMLIYSTSPISKVVGEARIEKVYIDTPNNIWRLTSQYAGINQEAYEHYYEGKNCAVAYKLSDVIRYDVPRGLEEYGIKNAPQSYYYIEK